MTTEQSLHIQSESHHRSRWTVCEAHMACSSSVVTIHEGGYYDNGSRLNLFSSDPSFWLALAVQAKAAAQLLGATPDV